jgi:hypothetical protein
MIVPVSFILGAALGMRFKVKILLPVQVLVILTVCSTSHLEPVYTVLSTSLLASFCLQAGYISGVVCRCAKLAARFHRTRVEPGATVHS